VSGALSPSVACAPYIGFRASGFGFRVSGFGFRVSGVGFQVSGFGFQGSGANGYLEEAVAFWGEHEGWKVGI
jgi:hypothetical protein